MVRLGGNRSSLTVAQRSVAVVWFGQGLGSWAVASRLGVPRKPVQRLLRRWLLHGPEVLVEPSRRSYSFEVKRDLVRRLLAGEDADALAAEGNLSSALLLRKWAGIVRRDGEDALRPRQKGRPKATPESARSELERLRHEVEYLRAENAYLGKLRALQVKQRRR
jgi:transposase